MNLKISDLQRITGIPKATLRYYDSIGLLTPERHEGSNYRSYTVDDLVRLVQVRQFNSLGLQLSELPSEQKDIPCEELYNSLCSREQALEQEIDQAYELLSRIRLHIGAYRQACAFEHTISLGHIGGVYRLFLSDPNVMNHPNTPQIVRTWMTKVPHVYSTIRISLTDLLSDEVEYCHGCVGIGLMKHVFTSIGETYREPMQYSPRGRCIQGIIETPSLEKIPKSSLLSFLNYIDAHALIPIDDLYGWIIYTPAGTDRACFRISLRLGVA